MGEVLIRKYLKAGVMTPQGYEETKFGTPRGGNYADDCVTAVRSESSAKRVMRTVSDWIQRKLGLKVNMTKTRITRPPKLKDLGFGFYKDSKTKEWKCRPRQDSVKRFKGRLKELTGRKMLGAVAGKTEKTVMAEIDAHLRTGLRIIIWKQWKEPKKRQWGLQKPGIGKDPARSCQKTPLAGAYDFVRNLIPGMSINIKIDK